MIKKQM